MEIFINKQLLTKAFNKKNKNNNYVLEVVRACGELFNTHNVADDYWITTAAKVIVGLVLKQLEHPKITEQQFENVFANLQKNYEAECASITVELLDNSKHIIGYELSDHCIRHLSALITSTKHRSGIVALVGSQLRRIVLIDECEIV